MSAQSLPKPVFPKDPKSQKKDSPNFSKPATTPPRPAGDIPVGSNNIPSSVIQKSAAMQQPLPTSPIPQPVAPPKATPPKATLPKTSPKLPSAKNEAAKASSAQIPSMNTPPANTPPVNMNKPLVAPPPSMRPPSSPPLVNKKNPAGQKKKNNSKATFAKVKQSPFKYLPFLVGGLILVGIVMFVMSKLGGNKTTPSTTDTKAATNAGSGTTQAATRKTVPAEQTRLVYWGLWEPDNTIRSILDKFEAAHPGVKVSYIKQSYKDYRERLQTAIASGNGPDVFRYHASWVPMLSEELASMPQSVMTASEYQHTFYPVAAKMLNFNGQIVGIPLMYDSLGLYVNTEMLNAANAQPPTTWAEVKTLAKKLTVMEGETVKRGGMAIGNASNVEHFSDILGLLMLQNGADLTQPSSKEAQDALSFYTNFVKQDHVWDDKLPSSTVAFARGDAAMMLAPSWRAHEVETMNPDLNFRIVPVPRLGNENLEWATFWAEGVNDKSKNKTTAWELLKFLSSKEIQQELYNSQSQVRSFGEIYSRTDLADTLGEKDLPVSFLMNASSADGWYLNSYTHDNGINDLLIKYYRDAVNAVLDGDESVEDALKTVEQGTKQVLRQYGVK